MLPAQTIQTLSQRVHKAMCVTQILREGDVLNARLEGELRYDSSGPLQEFLTRQVREQGVVSLQLDCSAISFVDSQGLAIIIMLYKQCKGLGGTLTLQSPTAHVLSLLKMTRLNTLVNIC